jgi:hypothetical protein
MAQRFSIIGLTLLSSFTALSVNAQSNILGQKSGIISSAVPFLRISPDARSGAMGDVGIALSPDANAQNWNVAKLATSDKDAGLSVTYTPWLKDIVGDVFLGYVSGYMKFGATKNQAISASLRYFNLGNIDYTNIDASPAGSGKPREFAFDVGYSRRLSTDLSVGINLRYIHSNIAAGATDPGSGSYSAASTFAGDFGVFYSKTKELSEDKSGTFSAGAVLSNAGAKISYTQNRQDFLPTNLGLGVAYTYKLDAFNKITGALDLNKALIPAPILGKSSTSGADTGYLPDVGVVTGMLNSFGKAPAGYGTTISVGAEYWYQDQFAVRAGYFYENKNNGNRQYFTCGLGVKYNVFGLNFSYLVPSGSGTARNPLSNTLRFSLLFDFDKINFSKKES